MAYREEAAQRKARELADAQAAAHVSYCLSCALGWL